VDDEQWLDRASPTSSPSFASLGPRIGRLDLRHASRKRSARRAAGACYRRIERTDAGGLLDSILTAPLDPRVRDQIVSETRGIPLAFGGVLRDLTPAELRAALARRGVSSLRERRGPSAADRTRFRPMLDALYSSGGDPVAIRCSSGELPSVSYLNRRRHATSSAGFTRVRRRACAFAIRWCARRRTGRRRFREAGSAPRAGGGDGPRDRPDRHAWHRAHAAASPDEEVAEELDRSAARAQHAEA